MIKYLDSHSRNIRKWTRRHYFQLAIFYSFVLFLFLMRSAGYFHPYFVISVNVIILAALLTSIPLLGVRSSVLFVVTILFWGFAAFLKVVHIDIWAERTAIYSYQALIIGVLLLIFDIHKKEDK